MILADKIIKLRKQLGWSQEELAEKMSVSRQSVSKWESTNSIPDLNKVIMLANLFNVSTDYLLKDDIEECDTLIDSSEPSVTQVSLEQALSYVESKLQTSFLITKGVLCCLGSVIPLFFFLAMAETNKLGLTGDMASAIGIVANLILVSLGVNFFIKTNQYEEQTKLIDDDKFELAYGVHSVFKEKLEKFRPTYNTRLSIGVFLFIISFVPLMFTAIFGGKTEAILMMLIALLVIIAVGIYIIMPASTKWQAFNNILDDISADSTKSKRTKRAEKLAAFYWPLLIAIYLGWSLWTMNWGVTWIVWPVGAVLFAALVGLMELLNKED